MDVVNQLMRQPETNFLRCSPEQVAELKLKAITIVKTMLEDNSEVALNLAKQILSILDLEAIFENMLHYQSDDEINEDYSFIDVAYVCANVLGRLMDLLLRDSKMTDSEKKALDKKLELFLFSQDEDKITALMNKYETRGFSNAYPFSQKLIRSFESIEILVDGELQKVYFRAPPRQNLTNRMKDELLYTVNRESPTERIRDFVDKGFAIQDKMKFLNTMNKNPISRFIIINSPLVYWMVLILSLAINIFMIATWKADGDATNPIPIVEPYYDEVIYILGSIHIFLSVLTVIGHVLTNPPIQFGKRDEFVLAENTEDIEEEETKDEGLEKKKKKKKGKTKRLNKKSWQESVGEVFEEIFSYIRFTDIYHLLFLVMSILGLVTQGYTFCFHLLHIVVGNDILLRVLQSVTKNGISLIWVACLGVIIIYIYSVVAFAFYRGSFDYTEQLWCDNMFQCFITSLDFGNFLSFFLLL